MNDFDYENKEKKAIARGAFHKKNGSKSKGCHLLSDDLSAAQRRKLNGPCKTVNLHQPMTWVEFKSLDHDIQQKYYDECFSAYGPSLCAFAKMLGVGEPTITKYFKFNDLKPRNDIRYRMTKIQKKMWAAFCNGVVGGVDTTELNKAQSDPNKKLQHDGYLTTKETEDAVYPILGIPNHPAKLDERRGWITEDDAQELGIDLDDIPEKDAAGRIKLDFNIVQPTVVDAANEAVEKEQQKTLDQLRFERDFYKARYFELLAILGERK